MTRVFIYEFLTGGGMLAAGQALLPSSLLREGTAMVQALASDFAMLDGVEVLLMQDRRLPNWSLPGCSIQRVADTASEWEVFQRLARSADWTVIIAPEFDNILEQRVASLEADACRLLGPNAAMVRLCADKHATAEHLRKAGIPAPHGIVFSGSDIPDVSQFPAVIKPRYGVGSQDMRLLRHGSELKRFVSQSDQVHDWRVEPFYSGLPASVAVLCGPAELRALVPCTQQLSSDGCFQYLGGRLPLAERLAVRARELALRAIGTLDRPLGYLGVDLVLGDDPSGREDVVIEINPRLTTSYVGLRAAAKQNLAGAMVAIAERRPAEIEFEIAKVEFLADGAVHCEEVGASS